MMYSIIAENDPNEIINLVSVMLDAGWELRGDLVVVYYPPEEQLWHYQVMTAPAPPTSGREEGE